LKHKHVPTRVSILDDHPMITDGVSHLLKDNEKFILTSVAHSWDSMITNLQQELTEILILDLNIRGVSIVSKISDLKKRFPTLKILVFSSYNTPSLVKKTLKTGVNGYLLKDTTKSELLEALETINEGEQYTNKRVAISKKRKNEIELSPEIEDDFEKKIGLSEREMEVLKLVANGYKSKEISERLFISQHTVQSHRKSIMKKLELHSAAEIVKFALENNLN